MITSPTLGVSLSDIDSEIERFRGILSDDQSMNLWKHISEFKPGELTNDLLGGGCIISH